MTLTGQEKMGYYPTPASLLAAIASFLSKPQDEMNGPLLLDPCCGEGEALAHVAKHLGDAETWGAELSPDRATRASEMLNKVHGTAWQHCKVGRGAVSLLYCNPPYDQTVGSNVREEQRFLEDTVHVLCEGGILIYIVPKTILGKAMLELNAVLRGTGVVAEGYAVATRELKAKDWWRDPSAARLMVVEYSKYLAILVREGVLGLGPRAAPSPPGETTP